MHLFAWNPSYILHKTACIKEKLLQCKSTIPSRAESNQADKNRKQFKKLHKTTQANFNWSSPTMYFPLLLVTLCAAALQVFTVAGQYRQLLYHYLENYKDSIYSRGENLLLILYKFMIMI